MGSEDPPREDVAADAPTAAAAPGSSPRTYDRVKAALFGTTATPRASTSIESIGRYPVERVIGAGGMGVVYLARDTELDRPVAIKLLRPELAHDELARQRMRREAMALARLAHPNVVMVFETVVHTEQAFVVMEYVEGHTLREWLAVEARGWEHVLSVLRQAAQGLIAAHASGLVHRDFKPDNVLVDAGGRARVVDFGLARGDVSPETAARTTESGPIAVDITAAGTIAGTPAYMAPEQFRGEPATAKSDQFSFCVTLYEALFGARPFRALHLADLPGSIARGPAPPPSGTDVPPAIAHAIARGLAEDPDDRWPDLGALLDALEPAPRRGSGRGKLGAWIGAVAGIGLAIALATRPSSDAAPENTATANTDDQRLFAHLPPTVPTAIEGDPHAATIDRLANGVSFLVAEDRSEPLVWAQICLRRPTPADDPLLAAWFDGVISDGSVESNTLDVEADRAMVAREIVAMDRLAALDPRTQAAERSRVVAELDEAATEASRWRLDETVAGLPVELNDLIGFAFSRKFGAYCHEMSLDQARVEAWLAWMVEHLRNPSFRNPLGRRRTVIEFGGESEPFDRAMAQLGRPTPLVDQAAVDRLLTTRETDAIAYFHGLAVPNNVWFAFKGDIDRGQIRDLLRKYVDGWEPAPTPAARDVDWGPARPRLEERSGGSLHDVVLAWRLPDAVGVAEARLLAALLDKLAPREAGLMDFEARIHELRTLFMRAKSPSRGTTELEAKMLTLLGRIADESFSDPTWRAVQRSEQATSTDGSPDCSLCSWSDASQWPSAFLEDTQDGFVIGTPWSELVTERRRVPEIDRDAIAVAARVLLDTPMARVHVQPGPTAAFAHDLGPTLDLDTPQGRSPLLERLLTEHYRLPEPRFLIEGRDFQRTTTVDRTTVVTNTPSSRFRLELWIEVGELDLPGICDVIDALRPPSSDDVQWEESGAEIVLTCEDVRTGLIVEGPAAGQDAALQALERWLQAPRFDPPAVATVRADVERIESALLLYLRYGQPTWLIRSPAARSRLWTRLWGHRRGVLYAGPDANRIAALRLPPGKGSSTTSVRAADRPRRIVAVALPDAGRITIVAVTPWVELAEPTSVDRWRVYKALPTPATWREASASLVSEDWEPYGMNSAHADIERVRDGHRRAALQVVSSAAADTETAAGLIAMVRTNEHGSLGRRLGPAEVEQAKRELESSARHRYIPRLRTPFEAYDFLVDGFERDPRIDFWQRLPAISVEDLEAFRATIPDAESSLGYIGPPEFLNPELQRRLGGVQWISVETLMPTLSDTAIVDPG